MEFSGDLMAEKEIKVSFLTQVFVRHSNDTIAPFLFLIGKTLLKLGAKVSVVCPHDKGLMKRESIEGIEITRFRYAPENYEILAYRGMMHELVLKKISNFFLFIIFLFSFTIETLRFVKKNNIDVIHAHWWIPTGLIGVFVAKLMRKPLVITSHGTDIFIIGKFVYLKFLAKWIFNQAKLITVVSTALKRRLIDDLHIMEDKIKVVPMPVDLERFYPKNLERKTDILCIGRLIERKGIDILVNAIARLRSSMPEINLVVVGTGPEKPRLLEIIKQNGLEGNITFYESVPNDELIDYYSSSKVFVLPTVTDWKGETEGLGVVLLEALSCKTPVVGTDTGGIPDIIKDNETGLLVKEKDVDGLAEAIKKLLNDEQLREKLANRGYEYARSMFNPEKISSEFLDIYKGLIKG